MDDHDERRIDRRIRTLKGGRIVYNRGFGTADCTIKNISNGGAMIETDDVFGIPSDFVLFINPDHLGRPCHICWRSGRHFGVAFTATAAEFAARPASQSMIHTH